MHPSPTRPKKAFPVTIPRVLLIALSLALAAMILAGALSGPGAQAQGPVPPTPTTVPTGDHQDPDDGSKTGDSPSENAARPTITLARHQTSITEGQRLDFILTASSAPSSNLDVNVSVVDNGNFLTGTVPTIITIAGGNTTAWLILFTSDDSTVESDAYITATINTGTGYFRGTTYQRSILVNDNDPAPPTSLNLTASNDDLALAYSRSVSPHRYQFQLHRAGSQNGTYSLVRTVNNSISPANFNNLNYQFWYKSRGRNCVYSNRSSCGPWSDWSSKIHLTNLPPPTNLNITVSDDDLTLTYTRSSSPHYYQFRLKRASGEYSSYTTYRTVNDGDSPAYFNNVTRDRWYRAEGRNCRNSNRTDCGNWGFVSNVVQVRSAVTPPPTPPTNLSLAIEANDNNDLDLTYTRSQSPHYYQFELHRATSANGAYTLYRTVNDRYSPADFDNVTTPRYYKAKGRNCRTSGRTGCGSWSPWTSSIRVPPAVSQSAPVFTQSTYSFDVDEDDAVNTLVGTVTANDPNAGDTVTYSITAGNSAGHFSIGSSTGRITVAGTLNRATNSTYRLTIRASDNHSNSNAATVNITVAATTNRPPAFGQSFYTFSAEESSALNSEVGTVSAADPDTGDTISYSIQTGNSSGHFGIQSSTGRITVIRTLDYETTSSYTLIVRASDNRGGTSDTTVFITIPAPVPSFQFTPNPMALGGTSNVWTVPSTATSIYLDVDFSAGFTKDSSAGNIVVSTTAPNGSTVRKLVDNENDRGFLSTVASGSSIRVSVDSDAFDASLATVTLTFRAAGSSGDVLATAVVRKEARPRAPWRGTTSVDAASSDVTLTWQARPPLLGANPDHYEVVVPGATSSATALYVNRNVDDSAATTSLVITGARARGMLGSHVANIYHCNEAGGCSTAYGLSFNVPAAPVAVAPAIPQGFEQIDPNYDSVNLWWKPVNNADSYQIRYATSSSGPWTVWSTSLNDSYIEIDDTIVPGTTYLFQVRSVGENGLNSAWSSSVEASILLGAIVSISNVHPGINDTVTLRALLTDDTVSGLSYQWQYSSNGTWTNIGTSQAASTLAVTSTAAATKEYRVVITKTGLSLASLSSFVTWDETNIVSGLVQDLNSAVEATPEYVAARTSFLACMNRSESGGASGQATTFTSFEGVFGQYTGDMRTKVDACDAESGMLSTIRTQSLAKLVLFGNATQANLNTLNVTGLTLVKLGIYADWLRSDNGREFVEMATDTDLLKSYLGQLAELVLEEEDDGSGASGSGGASGSSTDNVPCLGSSPNFVPNLQGKINVLNCLAFTTHRDFWNTAVGVNGADADDLKALIDDPNNRNRYGEWLGTGDWSCTSWWDGPIPSCLAHDVSWSSLEIFDSTANGSTGIDEAWNPRNKYLADNQFFQDIAKYDCQNPLWLAREVWCLNPLLTTTDRAQLMLYGVRTFNHLGWPITKSDVASAENIRLFVKCDIPRLTNARVVPEANWNFKIHWTLNTGCVPNPDMSVVFKMVGLDDITLAGEQVYRAPSLDRNGNAYTVVHIAEDDREHIAGRGFVLESIDVNATNVKVKATPNVKIGRFSVPFSGRVKNFLRISGDVRPYSTQTLRIQCTQDARGTWTCTDPPSDNMGATGSEGR